VLIGVLQMENLNQLIRLQDLPRYAGLRRTVILDLVKKGQFPRPIKLSDNGRAVAWLESEVRDWQNRRIAKREAGG
jgi:prophage regulatory protein